ncbi:MAG: hypothetical protein H6822_29860 [Planctomycetaceae bacterium]|nr:hypothetical protein [Planctomycetales bacterium]MCB9926390.1 hypothetical protein [Planctomycetaceae bacterium]
MFAHRTTFGLWVVTQSTILLTPFWTSNAFAGWFSNGDYGVVVVETSVRDLSRTVATLPAGTNFRVQGVDGNHVKIAQKIDGRLVSGWVEQDDVFKIERNQLAIYATQDSLVRNQGQVIKLPKGTPVAIEVDSDYAVDVFVISEEGIEAYKSVAKVGAGRLSSRAVKLDTRRGSLDWEPPNDEQYYVLVDNTDFPDKGADSGRAIRYSMAFCVEDPKPAGPETDKGLIIGRVTLDFDHFGDRNGRHREPFKVQLDVVDEDEKVLQTLEARVDDEGYFFVENLVMDRRYQIKKIDGSKFDVPVPLQAEFGFGVKDEDSDGFRKSVSVSGAQIGTSCEEPAILDLGHTAVRVDENGKIHARIDAAHATLASSGGQFTFGFGGDGPLDRHDWFLEKFPDNGWSGLVKLDRDSVYETREEAKRKKEAERKAKEEEKRSKEDADQKKRAENEQANGKNSDAEGDKAGEQDEASAGKDSEGSSPE